MRLNKPYGQYPFIRDSGVQSCFLMAADRILIIRMPKKFYQTRFCMKKIYPALITFLCVISQSTAGVNRPKDFFMGDATNERTVVYSLPSSTGELTRHKTQAIKTVPVEVVTALNKAFRAAKNYPKAIQTMVVFYGPLWKEGNLARYNQQLKEASTPEAQEYMKLIKELPSNITITLGKVHTSIMKTQTSFAKFKKWLATHRLLIGAAAITATAVGILASRPKRIAIAYSPKEPEPRKAIAPARQPVDPVIQAHVEHDAKILAATTQKHLIEKLQAHIRGQKVRNLNLLEEMRLQILQNAILKDIGTAPKDARSTNPYSAQITREEKTSLRDLHTEPVIIKPSRPHTHPVHGPFHSIDNRRNVNRVLAAWRVNKVAPTLWFLSTPEGKALLKEYTKVKPNDQRHTLPVLKNRYKQALAAAIKRWKIVPPVTHLIPAPDAKGEEITDDNYVVAEKEMVLADSTKQPYWTDEEIDQIASAALAAGTTDLHRENIRRIQGQDKKIALVDLERHYHWLDDEAKITTEALQKRYKESIRLKDVYFMLWQLALDCRNEHARKKSGLTLETAKQTQMICELKKVTELRANY